MKNDLVITTIVWIKKQGTIGDTHSINKESYSFEQAQYNFDIIKKEAEMFIAQEKKKLKVTLI